MARIRLDRLTPTVTLIVFLIIWWLTPSFIKLLTQTSFEEIQAPIWSATHHLEAIANNAVNQSKSKKELINTISELKRQNAYYKQIKNINENYKAEINRLESVIKSCGAFLILPFG